MKTKQEEELRKELDEKFSGLPFPLRDQILDYFWPKLESKEAEIASLKDLIVIKDGFLKVAQSSENHFLNEIASLKAKLEAAEEVRQCIEEWAKQFVIQP